MREDLRTEEGALDPRVYLAAERTLLAWVRTGLALMGFGFVIARSGAFLPDLTHLDAWVSLWMGTALVVTGVVVNLVAALEHRTILRRLESGQPMRPGPISLGVAVSVAAALLGVLMAGYLVLHPAGS